MSALTLFIIRHAEKPDRGFVGPGLTEGGVEDAKSLIVRGWQRSGSWAALFGASLGSSEYLRPDIIYAADPDAAQGAADADNGPSRRPFETVTPLAARLGLIPVTKWAVGQEDKLVNEIVGLTTGVVLVCWEHKAIAKKIVPALTKPQVLPGIPFKWDGARFDVVLRLDRALPSAPWSFRQLFPRLLAGDSDTLLPSGHQDDPE